MNRVFFVVATSAALCLLAFASWQFISHEASDAPAACPADALQCPDGSYVGRTAPNCEFAACPEVISESAGDTQYCTVQPSDQTACAAVYQPVCGLVEVQCITTPCNPVPQTFGNSCEACANYNVISYTDGACE